MSRVRTKASENRGGADSYLRPPGYDADVTVPYLDRVYSGKTLFRALMRKVARRFGGRSPGPEPVVAYNGILVFDRPDVHGGGLFYTPDFGRVLLELGLRRCEHVFEFCAGPGYLGYFLLALGFCERLTLADVNPDAVEAARQTAHYNGIPHRVNVYLSDGLSQIPAEEKWDLVVGTPPSGLMPVGARRDDAVKYDHEWSLHQRFYAEVGRYMKSGGRVVLLEERIAAEKGVFEPMIRTGGGQLKATPLRVDVRGNADDHCYVVSQW